MSDWQEAASPAWEEPLAFAGRFDGHELAFLYSSLSETFSGNISYLFVDPIEEYAGDDWTNLPPLPASGELPLWVGYLGYGMRENDARAGKSPLTLPDFRLVRYAQLYRFDHAKKKIAHYTATTANYHPGFTPGSIVKVAEEDGLPRDASNDAVTFPSLHSNLTRAEYETIVADTIEKIHAGEFYQANITRKFFGDFADAPDSWNIFTRLCALSPAPYSAYIRHGTTAILSSSPECFLNITADGTITTRPIKGSARRSTDTAEDNTIRTQLLASSKNHAENLMIVDLMRSDLARVSEPLSVEVVEQSALYSYRTIHHLISTIRARKSAPISVYEAVRACFPAGSMTGAPKIAAMRWCTRPGAIGTRRL